MKYPDSLVTRRGWLTNACGSIQFCHMIRGGFLSSEGRAYLQTVVRRPTERHGIARRANAILLLDDGWNCEDVARALYTGMLTDTGGFRFSNTSPKFRLEGQPEQAVAPPGI